MGFRHRIGMNYMYGADQRTSVWLY